MTKELILKKNNTQITLMDKNDIQSIYATKDEYIKISDLTVEKQNNADSGNVSTYVFKYDGNQIGAKINIPKDFLVKSGEVKTATNADLSTLGNDFAVGDKYIDFIINTVDNDESDQHMYINVKDLGSYNTTTATVTYTDGSTSTINFVTR